MTIDEELKKIREEFDKFMEFESVIKDNRTGEWYVNYTLTKDFYESHILRLLEEQRRETEKAYGGCHKCYGIRAEKLRVLEAVKLDSEMHNDDEPDWLKDWTEGYNKAVDDLTAITDKLKEEI